ncbi:MAG: hypothetical protein GY757_00470 [bacterium]|nr:hypothetical protein [bacterium]
MRTNRFIRDLKQMKNVIYFITWGDIFVIAFFIMIVAYVQPNRGGSFITIPGTGIAQENQLKGNTTGSTGENEIVLTKIRPENNPGKFLVNDLFAGQKPGKKRVFLMVNKKARFGQVQAALRATKKAKFNSIDLMTMEYASLIHRPGNHRKWRHQ